MPDADFDKTMEIATEIMDEQVDALSALAASERRDAIEPVAPYKVGQVVVLKSGSPPMTVYAVERSEDYLAWVICVCWCDGKKIRKARLTSEVLK